MTMNINYDKIADAIYFRLREGKASKTIKLDDRILADLDESGKIIGLEVLDASNQIGDIDHLDKNVLEGIPLNIISGTPAVA
jgi:uncharacterized protein YuzE